MTPSAGHERRPNVLFVLTDDQGYGDLSCHGNPILRTPNLDRLHEESVRMTDFHVSPVCTPTRAALMTGRNPLRTGAWATSWGRALLRRDETTMADIFRKNGYKTAMFGKWHLGDSYPYRPTDRGFEHAVVHRGGSIGSTPDYWGNDYFDDTYAANDRDRRYDGYCTDIWFDLAKEFLRENTEHPFFVYLATNAPHAPFRVPAHYKERYADNKDVPNAAYYGMIANIDENMGAMETLLRDLGLRDNTIVIFMTDNGVVSKGGYHDGKGFNAGMRGTKGSFYDGGHRVPCFVRWPAGGIAGGVDVPELTWHADLLPTLRDLCGLAVDTPLPWDGKSFARFLAGDVIGAGGADDAPTGRSPDDNAPLRADNTSADGGLTEASPAAGRCIHVLTRQGGRLPEKWGGAVLCGTWRLVNGGELYDIATDPAQSRDVADAYPEVVSTLRAERESFWSDLGPEWARFAPLVIGGKENPTRLIAQDLRVQPTGDLERGRIAWDQTHVVAGTESDGSWLVEVARGGRYRFDVRRWPSESGLALGDTPRGNRDAQRLEATHALIRIAGTTSTVAIDSAAESAVFDLDLEAGVTDLWAGFEAAGRGPSAAYYLYATRLDDDSGSVAP